MAVATTEAAGHVERDWELIKRAGLWIFFASESVLFGLLLAARFFIEGGHVDEHLDQRLGVAITSILLTSSVAAFAAESAIARGNRKLFYWGLITTIALGLVFAGGVAYEWHIAEFNQTESFGTIFFAMTGVHATHVLSGVVMLVLVLVQAIRGRYGPNDYWPVAGVVMYWHFVDVVWVFYYPYLYLINVS